MLQSSVTVDLAKREIEAKQAADLRHRLAAFAEDWQRPEMDVYDAWPAHLTPPDRRAAADPARG